MLGLSHGNASEQAVNTRTDDPSFPTGAGCLTWVMLLWCRQAMAPAPMSKTIVMTTGTKMRRFTHPSLVQ